MPLALYRRGKNGIFHYRGTIGPAGRRRRLCGSCHTTDKDVAARQVAEIEKRYWDGHFDGPGAVLTFDRAATLYLAAGKSPRFLGPVRNYLKNTFVKDINSGTVQTMAQELFGHCSGASKNRLAIVPAQSVINHCAELKLCQPIRVKRFKTETREKTPATLQWVQSFQAKALPHLGAYALFMFLTGCRPSEALAIDRDKDLNLNAGTAVIRETKISLERKAHLPRMLITALANLPVVADRPLFVYREYDDPMWTWNETIKNAGIERLTPGCCRHGFATELLRRGVDVITVAWLGGWESPEHVLKTYGHALKRRDLTNLLVDADLTHAIDEVALNARKNVVI